MDTEQLNTAEWIETVQKQLTAPQPDFDATAHLQMAYDLIAAMGKSYSVNRFGNRVTLTFHDNAEAAAFEDTIRQFDTPESEASHDE